MTAQHHVFLQSPYFIPDASIAEALKSAALSGIDVKVMLSARPSGDPVPAWAGNTFILDVVKALACACSSTGYMHAKTISIDSEIGSIGSANIDIRSFSINYELNAVLYSERLAKELEEAFERDLVHCTEFDPAAYGEAQLRRSLPGLGRQALLTPAVRSCRGRCALAVRSPLGRPVGNAGVDRRPARPSRAAIDRRLAAARARRGSCCCGGPCSSPSW